MAESRPAWPGQRPGRQPVRIRSWWRQRARHDMEQTDLLVEIAENNAEEDTLF